MDGFHVQGMTEEEGYTHFLTPICEPVPVKCRLHANGNTVPVWFYNVQKESEIIRDISMEDGFSYRIHNADIHGLSMEVYPTVELLQDGSELHTTPPF